MFAAELTDFTLEAQRMLRDDSNVAWYVVTLLVLVLYVYSVEVERRRWDIVLAGLAFWFADWINEIVNSLVLHFSDRAALWTVTGDTAYLILIGLCIEISFMFAISGIVYAKSLPDDPRAKLLGMPNRITIGLGFSIFAVGVELLLHAAGIFHWEYWWWNTPFVLPIVIFGYLWFFLIAAYVYDRPDDRSRVRIVGTMAAIVAVSLVVFGPILEWI
ncbi:MAG TPA: hypothetical protein VFN15_01480 [Solirubrobacterales bacterium]|nr:hypothetical protein [Solirubrobacterales bacterium]